MTGEANDFNACAIYNYLSSLMVHKKPTETPLVPGTR
jgi:hypothetical protein